MKKRGLILYSGQTWKNTEQVPSQNEEETYLAEEEDPRWSLRDWAGEISPGSYRTSPSCQRSSEVANQSIALRR